MIQEDFLKVDIEVAVFGIRELISPAKNPSIVFSLTTGVGGEKKIEKRDNNSRNPNIGQTIKFTGIMLPIDPLLWPMLEVQISDQQSLLSGCESCYTTIPLFEYATDILS